MTERVIVLVDMDCFYCQVETKLNPSLAGKPVAVVQYNAWKGGGIIAVNYEARDKGVSRSMRGDDAKSKCPDIQLVSVPTIRDKADLTKYRDASRDVMAVLCTYSDCVERASIDEAYLDLTDSIKQKQQTAHIKPFEISNTFIVGYSKEKCNDELERESGTTEWLNDIYINGLNDEASKNLAVAAKIVEEIRAEVFGKTGFRCSAGIGHNKILAKLACGLHKPNRQTVLPHSSVPHLYKTLSVKKVRHLGGKLGDLVMEKLDCSVMADLFQYSERELKMKFDEKNGSWLYYIARGIDNEPVKPRLVPKSIGCCKRFPGKTALKTKDNITYWLNQLTEELIERILEDQTMNKRKAQLLTVSMTLPAHQATSKAIPLTSYDQDKIYNAAYLAIRKICSNTKEESWTPIYCLGVSASKFSDLPTSGAIRNYFQTNQLKNSSSCLETNRIKSNSSPGSSTASTTITSSTTSFFSKFIKTAEDKAASISDQSNAVIGEKSNDSKNVRVSEKPDCYSEEDISRPSCSSVLLENLNKTIDSSLERPGKSDDGVKGFFSGKISIKTGVLSEPTCSSIDYVSKDQDQFEVSGPSSKPLKVDKSIKGFLSKKVSIKTEDLPPAPSCSTVKKRGSSIEGFFKNQNEYEIINPLDVFPDLSIIDDEMLQSFPVSFRRKVLALKKEMGACNSPDKNNLVNTPAISKTEHSEANNNEEVCISPVGLIKQSDEKNNPLDKNSKDWDSDDIFEDASEHKITHSETIGQTSELISENKKICPECGEKFDINDFPEHLDFHVAQRISLEINSVPAPSGSFAGIQTSNVVTKRKQSGRGRKITGSKKFKSLKTFFGS